MSASLGVTLSRMHAVISPNEFWLNLHRLAEAYDAEGATPQERAENIVAQFREMPAVARREVLAELVRVAVHIPELYRLVMIAANEPEVPKKLNVMEGAA
jgi:hypothetical protein